MKVRSPVKVFIFSLITCGIYGIYWLVSTKNSMNKAGAQVPTAWLIIIPLANYYWFWKYSEAVENYTGSGVSAIEAFLLLAIIGFIGYPIIQSGFNKVASGEMAGGVGNSPATMGAPAPAPLTETTMIPAQPMDSTPSITPNINPQPIAPVVNPSTPVDGITPPSPGITPDISSNQPIAPASTDGIITPNAPDPVSSPPPPPPADITPPQPPIDNSINPSAS
jgi:hypothetical protein